MDIRNEIRSLWQKVLWLEKRLTVAGGWVDFDGSSSTFLRGDRTFGTPPGVSDGDKGDITVTASGATWTIDNNAVTPAKASTALKTRRMTFVIGDGSNVISTGQKSGATVPGTGAITKVRVLSTDPGVTSGSIVVDLWKDTYANYPPTVADTITASAKPTLSTAVKSEDATLTGWTTSVTDGDVIVPNVDSVTSLKQVTVELTLVLS